MSNLWVKDNPFSLDTLKDVPRVVERGDYATSCDHKSGYQHVQLSPESQAYFGVQWAGWFFVFQTLPFGFKPGAFIYHCAAEGMAWEHISYGMTGLIMIEPKGGLKKVDHEFYVGQQDWYHDVLSDGAHGVPTDVYVLDEDKALDELPSLYTFNGHKNALTDPALFGDAMHSQQGDTVRYFFVNGGPNKLSSWHIIGTIFDKVYRSDPKDFVRAEETVAVPPGSAAVFELTTPVPGQYLLVDHALWRAPKGAAGFLTVDQTGNWPHRIYSPKPQP